MIENVPLIVYTNKSAMIVSHAHQLIFFFSALITDISVAYDHTAVGKAFHWFLADRITELMGIDRRIYQIIFVVDITDGWTFKVLISFKACALSVVFTRQDHFRSFLYCQHIIGKL